MTRRESEITDKNDINRILDTCKYLHLGLSADDMPYVVTLNYGYEWDETDGLHALISIMKAQTGKDDFVFDERLVSIVSVMRVDVKEMKAKKRELPEALRENPVSKRIGVGKGKFEAPDDFDAMEVFKKE